MNPIITGVGLGGLSFATAGGYYLAATAIRRLADNDFVVTYSTETMAKAVMVNGQFHKFVMSSRGLEFQCNITDVVLSEEDKWEVVEAPGQNDHWHLPLLRNVRWVGIPPFKEIYHYRFSWTSLEDKQLPGGKTTKEKVYTDKVIDYIFLRADVYVTEVSESECRDNIPLNATLLVSGKITNPYKALFKVERWLESSLNLVGSRMRSFFGQKTYEELRMIQEAMTVGTGMSHDLSQYFAEVIREIKDKWGFEIGFIQIYSISPGSKLAEDFIRATTQKYVAEQRAEAQIAEGRGLAGRDKPHYEAIASIPGALDLYKWDMIQKSKLTTYVEGGGGRITSSVQVGGNQPLFSPDDPEPDQST